MLHPVNSAAATKDAEPNQTPGRSSQLCHALRSAHRNEGVGLAWAWHSSAKLWPWRRVKEPLFRSLEKVGALAPTGSGGRRGRGGLSRGGGGGSRRSRR